MLSSILVHDGLPGQCKNSLRCLAVVGCATRSKGRSFFSETARRQRLRGWQSKQVSGGDSSSAQDKQYSSRNASVARTKALKACTSAQQVLATLRGFSSSGQRPVNSIQLSTIFTRLAQAQGDNSAKREVAKELEQDLASALATEFVHPVTRATSTREMVCVANGMYQVGLDLSSSQLHNLHKLLDKHLLLCNPTDLSGVIELFASTNYESEGLKGRLEAAIRNIWGQASARDLSRYLYCSHQLQLGDNATKMAMGNRILEIGEKPQQISNTALALSMQVIDGQELVVKLAAKMPTLPTTPSPQEISNVFHALHYRGWAIERQLAIQLIELFVEVIQPLAGHKPIPIDAIQVLRGLERHGVDAEDVELGLVVERALQKPCPPKYRPVLPEVAESLRLIGYQDKRHLTMLNDRSQVQP